MYRMRRRFEHEGNAYICIAWTGEYRGDYDWLALDDI